MISTTLPWQAKVCAPVTQQLRTWTVQNLAALACHYLGGKRSLNQLVTVSLPCMLHMDPAR